MGELIYGIVTFRPNISFPLIKLRWYSVAPSVLHFESIQGLYDYIRVTLSDGIYFWRKTSLIDLPLLGPNPTSKEPNNYTPTTRQQDSSTDTRAIIDLDYTNDSTHRKSVTGIAIKIVGGAVFYKTNVCYPLRPNLYPCAKLQKSYFTLGLY